jgi:hypothetical protein
MRRPLAVLAVALGVGLIAVPIATSLWSRTDGAENTFDVMRDFVSEPGIALARQNFGTVNAGGTEFLEKGVPFLDAQNVDLARYPDIAAGAEKIPGYLSFVGPTIDALDANREEFADADSLVGLGLPITAAPWLLVLLGAGFAGAGVLTLRRPGRAGSLGVDLGRPDRRVARRQAAGGGGGLRQGRRDAGARAAVAGDRARGAPAGRRRCGAAGRARSGGAHAGAARGGIGQHRDPVERAAAQADPRAVAVPAHVDPLALHDRPAPAGLALDDDLHA